MNNVANRSLMVLSYWFAGLACLGLYLWNGADNTDLLVAAFGLLILGDTTDAADRLDTLAKGMTDLIKKEND